MGNVFLLIIFISSIWVYFDAKAIGAQRGLLPGMTDMGPLSWAVCSLFLWIITFPLYLAKRSQIKAAAEGEPVPKANEIPQTGVNVACKYIAMIWTAFCLLGVIFGLASIGDIPVDTSNQYEAAGIAIGTSIGLSLWFTAWLFVALPATIIFFITRKTVVTVASNEVTNTDSGKTKKCPYCAEIIKLEAVVCRFCKNEIPRTEQSKGIKEEPAPPATARKTEKDWRTKARQFYKNSEFKEAAMAYSRAIKDKPSGALFYERAATYSKLKDKQKMKADLVAASNLGHSKAKQMLASK